jgi:hypothetical protein
MVIPSWAAYTLAQCTQDGSSTIDPEPEEDGWFIKMGTPWRQYNHT